MALEYFDWYQREEERREEMVSGCDETRLRGTRLLWKVSHYHGTVSGFFNMFLCEFIQVLMSL